MSDSFNLNTITFNKDSYIIVEGTKNDCFFVIQDGTVLLSRETEEVKERDGNILYSGDFFGVISALSHHSHIESAQALTDVRVIAVSDANFDDFIIHHAQMAMNIIVQFAERMRYLNKVFTQRTLNDTSESEDVVDLFEVGKYYDSVEHFSHASYAYRQYLRYCPDGEHVAEAQKRLDAVKEHVKATPFTSEGNKRMYAADTVLYAQGEPGEEMFVVQSGSVKISKIVNNSEVLLAVLNTGDIIGEMAILGSKPRSVTAVTVERTSLISISKANFTNIVASSPQIVAHLMKSMAERIWFIYKQLANSSLSDILTRMYDMLLIQLEKNKIPDDLKCAYSFSFGLNELLSLIGVSQKDAEKAIQKFAANSNITCSDDAIFVENVATLTKEANYYKNAAGRKKAFREAKEPIPRPAKPDEEPQKEPDEAAPAP
ncbi:MAG: cyclic nucleotide-binding domain-containing protein [Treponema sp.]|nr:cyclic nucleotide-binding domain-containing protein [Treponema sp.]